MSQENVKLVQQGFEHFLATGEPAWNTLRVDYFNNRAQAFKAAGLEE